MGHTNIQGGIQLYRGIKVYGVCTEVWGANRCMGVYRC